MTYPAAQLWSLNALAGEIGMDRRTLRGRLREVPPDGQLKGHPAWYFRTVLDAVVRKKVEQDKGELDARRERALLDRARRKKVEFENAVAGGRYLKAAEVEAADAALFTAIRDRVRAVASCSPLLVQTVLEGSGESAVKRLLERALDEALEEIGSAELVSAPESTP